MTKHYSNVNLVNKTNKTISEIKFLHRYDSDVYNYSDKDILEKEKPYLICVAEYWTGFLRVGVDYWWIQFKLENTTYTCKANFFCTLMSEDGGKDVTVEVHTDKMYIKPAKSSSCYVGLYEPSLLAEQFEQELILSGIATEPQPASAFKKCNCD